MNPRRVKANAQRTVSMYREPNVYLSLCRAWGITTLEPPTVQETGLEEERGRHGPEWGLVSSAFRGRRLKEGNSCAEL